MRARDAKVLVIAGLLLFGLWLSGPSARAGVSVSPSVIITNLPEDGIFAITVGNPEDSPQRMSVVPAGLKLGPTGGVRVQESEEDLRTAAEIFHPQPAEFILSGGESKVVTIEVTPSEGAEGGLYGTILVTASEPEAEAAMVAHESRVAVPVLLTLPGPTEKAGEITGVDVVQQEAGGTVEIKVMFRDTGNIHFHVTGKAFIENEDGVEVAQVSLGTHTVVPTGYDRLFSARWKPEGLPAGDYTVRAEMEIEDGPTVTSTGEVFHVISSYKVLQLGGEIVDFPAPKVAQHKPITFNLIFFNRSNVGVSPEGGIEIKDSDSNVMATVLIAAAEEIAPNSSSELRAVLEEGLPQGEYTASVRLEYGKPEYGETRIAKAETKFEVVEKEIVIDGEIVEFTMPSVESGEPIVPKLLLKNTGNTDFEVEGLIELKNSEGKTVGQIPIPATPVAVGETKRLGQAWEGNLPKGLYTAVTTLILGGEKILTAEASFVVK